MDQATIIWRIVTSDDYRWHRTYIGTDVWDVYHAPDGRGWAIARNYEELYDEPSLARAKRYVAAHATGKPVNS